MIRRSSAPSAAARRTVLSVPLAGVALALSLCAFPVVAAHAEPACPPGTVCIPTVPGTPSESPTPDPAPQPAEKQRPTVSPEPPVVTQPPAPVVPVAPQPTQTPEPSATAEETPSPEPTTTETATSSATPSSTSSPSVSSNWNTPIEDGKTKAQAATLASDNGNGPNMFGLFAIMGGVLLVGLGGMGFALWMRNRVASH
ncbi:hypothetical protein [Arthrobacter sp. CJ23]|uniref:hypothetical protein n=1 Tax=Arthrobacter sp. CJ23 TaxID=2972479 RepID=UPI00215CA671|nr:hypothetical protein [Arthrobacter sp. CJ23]UVJ40795.1 hypothetical protein NVV90_06395 [Arthrobacter sp. CJ23]